MKLGEIVEGFSIPPYPKGVSLEGKLVDLKPLKADEFAEELFQSNSLDEKDINWTYLPYGPFETAVEYANWIKFFGESDDPNFLAIISKKLEKSSWNCKLSSN